jgi:NMD protein affecting ribosome stability and mRNA decay
MQVKTMETVSVVNQIRCDRCGKEAERGELGFQEMISIGFKAGYASIFGDGNRVEVDLCESCLRDSLGAWLRVNNQDETPLATMLARFNTDIHGGEFPPTAVTGPNDAMS